MLVSVEWGICLCLLNQELSLLWPTMITASIHGPLGQAKYRDWDQLGIAWSPSRTICLWKIGRLDDRVLESLGIDRTETHETPRLVIAWFLFILLKLLARPPMREANLLSHVHKSCARKAVTKVFLKLYYARLISVPVCYWCCLSGLDREAFARPFPSPGHEPRKPDSVRVLCV